MFQPRHFLWAVVSASLSLVAVPANSNEETEHEPVEKRTWVPTDVGRRWTYLFVSERSIARSGEEPHVEKLRGTRVDEISGLAPEIGENVIRVQSRLVGRTAGDASGSSDEKTGFYRATPSSYQLVAERTLDPTSGSAPLVRYEVPLAMLELTAEPGQRWKVGVRSQGDLHTDLEGEVLGVQNAQTPHSLFENCRVIRLSGQISGVIEVYGERMEVPSGDYTVTQWYAPGMGLVLAKEELRQTLVRGDGSSMEYSERNQFALRSVEPADAQVPAASE